ncbi:MAG: tetratricopeptide repeat protein [Bdellovibrionales bacterium]|nr:tetratricopeptide repeat protein [Bdellovibrionales bacterium]
MSVRSEPSESEVLVRKGSAAPVKLGATPFVMTSDNSREWLGDSFELIVRKEGYAAQSVVVPKLALGASSQVDIVLKEAALPQSCAQQDLSLNEIASGVAQAQYFLSRRSYEESRRKIQELINKFPGVAALHTLLGNLFYIQKDFQSALEAYRRSKRIQPENAETTRMIEKLSSFKGGQ